MTSAEGKSRKVGNYEILETLGKGGYSWVKKGLDQKKNRHVALKFMTRADSTWAHEQAEQVRTEIKSLTQIRHQNVMKLYAYNLNAKYPQKSGKAIATILLVLEYCPGGELFDILYYTDKLDEKTARTYFRMMIDGIQACHDAGIAHRDIKPQNLLLDREYQLKLTDFGLSKIREDPNVGMSTTYVGTRGYQAPELLAGKKYFKSCDLFSAGVVLFILLTGYPPFDQGDKRDKWYRPLYKNNPDKFWTQHEGCGVAQEAKSLIEGLLCYKPNKRMTIAEVKNHPWYKAEVWSKEELKTILKKKHKLCNDKRKKDANKQAEMVHSVKRRDIPDAFIKLIDLKPEKASRPVFNTLDVEEATPFEAIWRVKELFESRLSNVECSFDENKPFQFNAKLVDAGTMNIARPKVADDEDAPKEEEAAPQPNVYNILVSVKQDADVADSQFVQFQRGMCTGAHSQLKFRQIMGNLMPKIMADPIFQLGWKKAEERAKAAEKAETAEAPAGGVLAGCTAVLTGA